MGGAMTTYGMGPFALRSEVDLSALGLGAAREGDPVVTIRFGAVAAGAREGVQVSAWVTAGPGGCVLNVPDLGRFGVIGGDEVVVELQAGADMGDVRSYLTAWCFGALCHQNGMLPLHASAVEREGRVTAFLGESGAGKSTLAAFLERRGDRVVCDDICLIDEGFIVPVAAWLKLWRGSIEALEEAVEEGARTYGDEDKYRRRVLGEAARGLRVGRVVFLERGEGKARLERVSSAEALGRMMGMIYLKYVLGPLGIEGRAFAQCAEVLGEGGGVGADGAVGV